MGGALRYKATLMQFSRVFFNCFIFEKITIENWGAGEHKPPVPDLPRHVILFVLNHDPGHYRIPCFT